MIGWDIGERGYDGTDGILIGSSEWGWGVGAIGFFLEKLGFRGGWEGFLVIEVFFGNGSFLVIEGFSFFELRMMLMLMMILFWS